MTHSNIRLLIYLEPGMTLVNEKDLHYEMTINCAVTRSSIFFVFLYTPNDSFALSNQANTGFKGAISSPECLKSSERLTQECFYKRATLP